MIRRPPRSTRTDTLFPYTTLFRSHLRQQGGAADHPFPEGRAVRLAPDHRQPVAAGDRDHHRPVRRRSEEHTSELQSLMRISYAVFCLKKKKKKINNQKNYNHNMNNTI